MIIGAFGKAGRLIMDQALNDGHQVVAVSRHRHPDIKEAKNILTKDMRDLNKNDMSDLDAVVDATGAWTPETETVHYQGLLHMMHLLKNTDVHYLKVGGSNTLFINSEHTRMLQELPLYYPDYMQDLCSAHAEGLRILRTYTNVNWTYVTPTYNFDPFGRKTGNYQVEGEEFKPAKSLNPNDGKHDYISYADFAKGVIDIVEENEYLRQRITLVSGNNPNPTRRY